MNTISMKSRNKAQDRIALCITLILLVFAVVSLTGCGGDDPTAAQVMTKKLTANTWKVSNVIVDGADETGLFTNMTLTFTKTNYTTTNGGVVWPVSGTWEFADKKAKTIIRNDDLEIEIIEATSSSLKLSLNWTRNTFGPGRIGSVAGDHVFTFSKN